MKTATRVAAGFLASILLIFAGTPPVAASPDGRDGAILLQIAKIKSEKKAGARTGLAHELSDMVQREDPNSIRKDEILGLVRMMDDKADGVRMWTAHCLGFIGPRAVSAAPALRRAYAKIRCTNLAVSSRPEIEAALANIGGKLPVLAKCPS